MSINNNQIIIIWKPSHKDDAAEGGRRAMPVEKPKTSKELSSVS